MPASTLPVSRRARLLIGLLFLALAVLWAVIALNGGRRGQEPAPLQVRVRVVDADGQDVPGADVRSRYGGAWLRSDAVTRAVDGAALPLPRGEQPADQALADALEVRAAFFAARRGHRAEVRRAGDGALEATVRVERCGLLRVGVATSAFREVRAVVDPDPGRERWRLVEGREVVRGGEAATWAVFPGATTIGVTLEGDQGVSRQRLVLRAPGIGFLAEETLFPLPAAPILGRVTLEQGPPPPTLAGRLEVREVPEQGPPIEHPDVRVEPDGSFRVDYAGPRRYELTAHLGFARDGARLAVEGGANDVLLQVVGRPWIEVGPESLAQAPLGADLVPAGRLPHDPPPPGRGYVPEGGVLATPRGLAVAAPWPGPWLLTLWQRGSDEAPPRGGSVRVEVPESGAVGATLALTERPHGTVTLRMDRVPPRGADVLLLPDRRRTWLQGFAGEAAFRHVEPGRILARVRFNDPDLATDLLVGSLTPGADVRLTPRAERGGRVVFDVGGSPLSDSPDPWALHVLPGRSPYGEAEGTIDLVREGASDVFVAVGGLRAGRYEAEVHPRVPSREAPLPVTFEVSAGATVRVPIGPR